MRTDDILFICKKKKSIKLHCKVMASVANISVGTFLQRLLPWATPDKQVLLSKAYLVNMDQILLKTPETFLSSGFCSGR